MTRRRDLCAAFLMFPLVSMAGRCSVQVAEHLPSEAQAFAKGAGAGALKEYRKETVRR